MIKQFNANKARNKRHRRLRNHLEGTQNRPRLSVFRSGVHIYAQVVDDTTGQTLAAASSLDSALRDFKPPKKEVPDSQQRAAQAQGTPVEMAAEAAPTKGKGARVEKAPARGAPQ